MNQFRIIFGIVILVLFTASGITTNQNSKKNILILNSYHPSYKWTDDIVRGITETLNQTNVQLSLHIEYMDTKRYSEPDYLDHLKQLYKFKYLNYDFDVIISSDDHAFNFMAKNRAELFPETPIVFCGVNYLKKTNLINLNNYTGVNEKADIQKSLDIALRLHPQTENVFIVNDRTETGLKLLQELNNIIPGYPKAIKFSILDNLPMKKLLHKLKNLPPNSIVYYTIFFKDADDVYFDYDDSILKITASSNAPVYATWDFSLGYGIAGGLLTSGYFQGETAAHMAIRILNGEKAEQIPVAMDSPNRYMFDAEVLNRYGITKKDLPESAFLINNQLSFYQLYKSDIWAIIVFILLQTAAIIFLFLSVKKRKLIEKELIKNKNALAEAQQITHVGNWYSDIESREFYWSEEIFRIFGFRPGEIVPTYAHFINQIHKEDREKVTQAFYHHLSIGNRYSVTFRIFNKNNTERILRAQGKTDFDENNKVIRISGLIHDITEKQKRDNQLLQAQKMQTVGNLAGGLAHDFNNILNGIIGTNSLMKMMLQTEQKISTEELMESIEIIEESSKRATDIVKQLLTLSRTQEITLAPVNINMSIKHVMKICANTLDKTIEQNFDYDDKRLMIEADPTHIEQVILNLCVNAAHAMTIMRKNSEDWGGTLDVYTERIFADEIFLETHPEARKGYYWVVVVKDSGIGMKHDLKMKIFDPFFTTKDKEYGTGLGLAMVYNTVKQLNGFVNVYSEPDVGTTFNMFLPETTDTGLAKTENNEKISMVHGAGLILIIDDEKIVRTIARKILERCGYHVISAEDGFKGIEIFKQRKKEIKAVLLDMAMPGLSGEETFIELKNISRKVKVLLASGYKQDVRIDKTIELGVNGFIQKPYTIQNLSAKIAEIINM